MTSGLLILDSTAVVAVLRDIKGLDMLRAMLEFDHDLAIPYSVYVEVSNGPSAIELKKAIAGKKIRVTSTTSKADVDGFVSKSRKLDPGEIDVILTYEKISHGGRPCCILDDKRARKVAELRGVKFIGIVGLLRRMKDNGVISSAAHDEAIGSLRKAGFYMPKEM